MNARPLFFTGAGGLRAPWRIVFFLGASVASLVVAATIVGPILITLFSALGIRGVSTESWVEAAGLLGGTAIA